MNARKKGIRVGIFFIALLIIGGLVLLYQGNDAVVQGIKKKEGILTAEEVRMSFDSVGGRLITEKVKEGDFVKAGDVVMEIDPTDTDLAISRTKAGIAQLEAQIKGLENSMALGFERADVSEVQNFRQIDQQRAAIISAAASLKDARLDYERAEELFRTGAIAESARDDAKMAYDVANARVREQEELLQKMLSGAKDTGTTDNLHLPSIETERKTAANMANDIEALTQQKNMLLVELEELMVKRNRLTLKAPEDGKILKVIAKKGEMISPNTPVILLESDRRYYDIYVSETQTEHLAEGKQILGSTVSGQEVPGTIRLLTQAPGFADLKQTREKGQADLTAFLVRIYVDKNEKILPGMTIGVRDDELAKE